MSDSTYLARIYVSLKPTVNDPAGNTIQSALASLGYQADSVRSGKFFQITLQSSGEDAARTSAEEMCKRLLANPVIETYEVEIEPAPAA